MTRTLLAIGIAIAVSVVAQAQSTYSQVVNILQSNCAVNCHQYGNLSGNLDLSSANGSIYNSLVDATPDNAAAAAAGYKLVKPGYPEKSFLLKKLIHALDQSATLATGEGDPMPQTGPAPSQAEIELIRQWILYGASETSLDVDSQLVADYFAGQGIARKPKPAPPAAGEGFQLHLGPIILAPQTEIEFYKKEELNLASDIEIRKLSNSMNEASHHLIIYKYNPGAPGMFDEGLREVGLGAAADVNLNATYVITWQYEKSHELPEGTAYFWDKETVIDLNYHILNYSPDSVMAAEVYVNVYTQPNGTAQQEMKTSLVVYNQVDPFQLVIPNHPTDTTIYQMEQVVSQNDSINLWLMQGHTHRLGVDYDVYKRNSDGTRGDQIYEGFYNQSYTANQGFYDWEHPPVREFDPLMPIAVSDGLIHEAKYFNAGADTVTFGLTTQDEMFITYYQYTERLSTGLAEAEAKQTTDITVYPNPAKERVRIDVKALSKVKEVSVKVFDALGALVKKVTFWNNQNELDVADMAPGFYTVQVQSGETLTTSKFMKE